MNGCTHKFLLVMIVLSLALAPLRAAWSMPVVSMTDAVPHCAQMQGTLQTSTAAGDVDTRASDAGDSTACKGCCEDHCNGSDCGTCVHGAAAVSSILAILPAIPASPLNTSFVSSVGDRTVIPPLRPPVSL